MPRTIEHPIRLLNRPSTPPNSPHGLGTVPTTPVYGTIRRGGRQTTYNNNDNVNVNVDVVDDNNKYSNYWSNSRSSTTGEGTKHWQGDKMTFGTENFERNLRYSPNEIQRQNFSSRSFGEHHSLGGGDSESRASVRFQDELSPAPQAPLEPLKPIDHTYESKAPFAHPIHRPTWTSSDEEDEQQGKQRQERENTGGTKNGIRMLPRTPHLDTTPIRIPRPKLYNDGLTNNMDGYAQQHQQPNASPSGRPSRTSWHTSSSTSSSSGFGQSTTNDERSKGTKSGRSSSAFDDGHHHRQPPSVMSVPALPSVPMKKVIRKSRWVSIHTGRPVSNFVESVHYEPVGGEMSERNELARAESGRQRMLPPSSISTSSTTQKHQRQAAHFSPELWTSSSSCSLSSNDEDVREGRKTEWNGGGYGHAPQQRQLNNNNGTGDNQHHQQHHQRGNSVVYVVQNPVYPFGRGRD